MQFKLHLGFRFHNIVVVRVQEIDLFFKVVGVGVHVHEPWGSGFDAKRNTSRFTVPEVLLKEVGWGRSEG